MSRNIPDAVRRAIQAQHPTESWRLDASGRAVPKDSKSRLALETLGREAAKELAKPKATKKTTAAKAQNISGIRFDSTGEANAYLFLCSRFRAVFCHPQIALSEADGPDGGRHMKPDFLAVVEVLANGDLVVRPLDYKGEWNVKTKSGKRVRKVHAEDDWKVRRSWLFQKTGIWIREITNTIIARLRAGESIDGY